MSWFRWRIQDRRVHATGEDDHVRPIHRPGLAPLQQVMLRDSLAEGNAGHHVEQVEIVFAPGQWRNRVAAAWAETVARTEALRIVFSVENGKPVGVEPVGSPPTLRDGKAPPRLVGRMAAPPTAAALCLLPGEVPWRAAYWPRTGRFLWTFHHALLDGRSITAILRCVSSRIIRRTRGGPCAGEMASTQQLMPSLWRTGCSARISRLHHRSACFPGDG